VEVSGRVLDYFTHEPIQVEVALMGDDATSAKSQSEGTIFLASMTSKSDGTFHLKSKPSRRDNYYISVFGGVYEKIDIELNKNNDLGDFIAGSHDIFCNITVIPRSDSTLRVQKNQITNDTFFFDTGTNATVQNSLTFYYSTFINYNGSFPIRYTATSTHPPYYGTNYYKYVPITSLTGPLTTTIHY
jgi:hypothetical protein